ncbi:histidine kinase [Clostridium beijerinckii]|jgi:Predicted signal transduction protein with a C-terminal ATPase domain|uniref:Histidine kinase n=2 Tax=Clostridium TaxID=1485 RepID=A0AB74VEG6_CLOBE|nr:histidine kinase [Clostridium beijerinckii]MDG5852764.1 histidine kinase [Clostridium beijerinckii]NOW87159.1 two-component system sensor histidine kinase YesM [Clostridium beijerinckii]NRZ29260.1 two-component system sensor histidine kinase YesM [Clostridium beijerinckii]NYB94969.1 two-component system sensor histidine kinase YesM [Clostridium beijerinckii]OOM27270.1 sensor histidine kinase YehU [Clostridium beijerinckii]
MNRLKRFFLNLKFRYKIILTYFLVSIIPIIILGLFCYQQTKNLLLDQERENLRKSFSEAVIGIENSANVYSNILDYTTFNPMILEVINHEYKSYYEMYYKFHNMLDPYIDMLRALHNDIQQITVYTSNNIVKHSDYIMPMEVIENNIWYKEVLGKYKPQWFIDSEKNVFLAVQFINKGYNDIQNILYVKINSKNFFQPLYNISSTNCGIYVVDKNDEVVFENRSYDDGKDYLLPSTELKKIDGDTITYDNINYILIKIDMKDLGWTAYLYKPVHLIVESSKNIIYTVFFIMGICVLIILVVGYWLSYIIVNRIEKLTKNMKEMNMDHLEVTIESNSEDEIGVLINSFDKLIVRIKTLIQEVYKSEISKRKYEMKALQAQINPHFLYNSLSLINWKAIRSGEDEISEMAQLLSTFYRTSLNKGSSIITVENELNNTEAYVKIQSMMHNYNFDVDFDIDNKIKGYYMINLLLQPLVENAICHGIDQKRNNRGKLRISAQQKGTDIVFEIEDNGVGMKSEICERILTTRTKGYGVKNVYDRIKLTYGENCDLRFISIPNEKTVAIMSIPVEIDKNKFND